MNLEKINMNGLNDEEVKKLQEEHGKNVLNKGEKESFFKKILHILSEPMFLLLIAAAIIYFILGEPRDGIIMLVFVIAIISIDVIQEWKTDKTLSALRDLSAPKVKVIRNGNKIEINSDDLVPGDLMLIYEGVKVPADGYIIKCNGLSINESSLTGESVAVWKHTGEDNNNEFWKNNYCYAGTLVIQGSGTVYVDKTGNKTEYGKIGANVASATSEDTPLQKQTRFLVKICAYIALVLFLAVAITTFFNIPDHNLSDRLIESLLSGITLAMAMIPEEFPVILTVFLSMGAWRLAKKNSLVKKLSSVETLGAVSVLCVDKTGTITMNQMEVETVWSIETNNKHLSEVMGLCCEEETYDPMEQAMIKYCKELGISKKALFSGEKIKHYPFTNETKMMGNILKRDGEIILAAKGSPESILKICNLNDELIKKIEDEIEQMSLQGLRVIAVGKKIFIDNKFPESLEENNLEFLGLIGLIDPPRDTVTRDIALCKKAGIRIVMITGDNGITASSIAKKIGMESGNLIITGDMLNEMSDEELREKIKNTNIFSRVVPEHKMRIVKAFKANGEIVAMTGDGVNDAAALKYADIGISMGKRGSEVSREASDLILLDDNFSTIVDTIKDGRRIYDNIRKAVGYVFTIHIPIAFASLLAPILGIDPVNLLLLPLHVVLLELIIDPTCSIILERQPAEDNIMDRMPRNTNDRLITFRGLFKSITQGLVMFAASFLTYYYILSNNIASAEVARAMGIIIIMISNLFLVQVNSSYRESAFSTFKKLIRDNVMWAVSIVTILEIALILYSPINTFLKLAPLSLNELMIATFISFVSVFWYELVKLFLRIRNK